MILNIFSLKNKVSLVTGAYGYLGKQICKTLADAGSDIILIDKNSKKKTSMLFLQELKKKYKKQKFYSFSCEIWLQWIQSLVEYSEIFLPPLYHYK